MTAFLARDLTRFALCWRLERTDGVALGFTAHDRDLWLDGFRYRAAPGIVPSAIEEGDPLDADALSVTGVLDNDAIRAEDLRAGRWNGATVRVLAVDWEEPIHVLELCRGWLGGVALEKGEFRAELKGLGALLQEPIVEETGPLCRASLGDQRCRVSMAGRRVVARVIGGEGEAITVDRPPDAAGHWTGGRVRWLDGANGGLTRPILQHEGAELTLAEPHAFAPALGRVEIIEGCDKRFSTCRDRFGNAANFRGEPHLPGMDLLTRYPGE